MDSLALVQPLGAFVLIPTLGTQSSVATSSPVDHQLLVQTTFYLTK